MRLLLVLAYLATTSPALAVSVRVHEAPVSVAIQTKAPGSQYYHCAKGKLIARHGRFLCVERWDGPKRVNIRIVGQGARAYSQGTAAVKAGLKALIGVRLAPARSPDILIIIGRRSLRSDLKVARFMGPTDIRFDRGLLRRLDEMGTHAIGCLSQTAKDSGKSKLAAFIDKAGFTHDEVAGCIRIVIKEYFGVIQGAEQRWLNQWFGHEQLTVLRRRVRIPVQRLSTSFFVREDRTILWRKSETPLVAMPDDDSSVSF